MQHRKGAVVSLSRSLAAEFAQHNIRVNVISPGTIVTEMAPIQDPLLRPNGSSVIRWDDSAQPADIEGAAVYLASEESAWTTGIELLVDGGTTSFYV